MWNETMRENYTSSHGKDREVPSLLFLLQSWELCCSRAEPNAPEKWRRQSSNSRRRITLTTSRRVRYGRQRPPRRTIEVAEGWRSIRWHFHQRLCWCCRHFFFSTHSGKHWVRFPLLGGCRRYRKKGCEYYKADNGQEFEVGFVERKWICVAGNQLEIWW